MNDRQRFIYRALVVDDEPTNALILSRALSRAGYEVKVAGNGQEAIDMADDKLDVVLMDMMMPGMDGFQACAALKANPATAAIPVLFVTAMSDNETVLKAFRFGGCDYITKPFRTDEVLARISVHARLRRAEAELLVRHQKTEELARQLAQMNVRLLAISRIDPLTKLLNRRAWAKMLRNEQRRAKRYLTPYSLLMVDIDHFKAFNDSRGHLAGDLCLRRVAKGITCTCRQTDYVGRYGGEEFVVLATHTDEGEACRLAERIREAIWELKIPHPQSPTAGRITVSIGVAVSHGRQQAEVLADADAALYEAKSAGRNLTRARSLSEAPLCK